MTNWHEAAERYRKAQHETQSVEVRKEIEQAARMLDLFLESDEGKAALELLSASRRHIRFGERPESGMTTVYFLNGDGLRKSVEAAGMWTAYAKDVPPPRLSPLTALEAISVAANPECGADGGRKPDRIIPWLRIELDAIAMKAPA